MVANSYFDQSRSKAAIILGNGHAKLNGNHFLAAADQEADAFVRVHGARHHLVAVGNTMDLAGSRVRSFIHYRNGTPNGGAVSMNACYGEGPAWEGFVLDGDLRPVASGREAFMFGGNSRRA